MSALTSPSTPLSKPSIDKQGSLSSCDGNPSESTAPSEKLVFDSSIPANHEAGSSTVQSTSDRCDTPLSCFDDPCPANDDPSHDRDDPSPVTHSICGNLPDGSTDSNDDADARVAPRDDEHDSVQRVLFPSLGDKMKAHIIGKYGAVLPGQQFICDKLDSHQHIAALLPTNSGKSALIAALLDAHQSLSIQQGRDGNDAIVIVPTRAIREQLAEVITSESTLTYPEELVTRFRHETLGSFQYGLVIIDECHLLLDWGLSFRPSMRLVASLLGPHTKLLMLSATMSDECGIGLCTALRLQTLYKAAFVKGFQANVQHEVIHIQRAVEIRKRLDAGSPAEDTPAQGCSDEAISHVTKRRRKTPTKETVKAKEVSWGQLVGIVERVIPSLEQACLVFVDSKEKLKKLVKTLSKSYSVRGYHSDLPKEHQRTILADVNSGSVNILVSTTALNCGVHCPAISSVVLTYIPSGMSEFLQMTGRCGRGEQPARAVFLYDSVQLQRRLNSVTGWAREHALHELHVLQRMVSWLDVGKCIRPFVLNYLCGNTDKVSPTMSQTCRELAVRPCTGCLEEQLPPPSKPSGVGPAVGSKQCVSGEIASTQRVFSCCKGLKPNGSKYWGIRYVSDSVLQSGSQPSRSLKEVLGSINLTDTLKLLDELLRMPAPKRSFKASALGSVCAGLGLDENALGTSFERLEGMLYKHSNKKRKRGHDEPRLTLRRCLDELRELRVNHEKLMQCPEYRCLPLESSKRLNLIRTELGVLAKFGVPLLRDWTARFDATGTMRLVRGVAPFSSQYIDSAFPSDRLTEDAQWASHFFHVAYYMKRRCSGFFIRAACTQYLLSGNVPPPSTNSSEVGALFQMSATTIHRRLQELIQRTLDIPVTQNPLLMTVIADNVGCSGKSGGKFAKRTSEQSYVNGVSAVVLSQELPQCFGLGSGYGVFSGLSGFFSSSCMEVEYKPRRLSDMFDRIVSFESRSESRRATGRASFDERPEACILKQSASKNHTHEDTRYFPFCQDCSGVQNVLAELNLLHDLRRQPLPSRDVKLVAGDERMFVTLRASYRKQYISGANAGRTFFRTICILGQLHLLMHLSRAILTIFEPILPVSKHGLTHKRIDVFQCRDDVLDVVLRAMALLAARDMTFRGHVLNSDMAVCHLLSALLLYRRIYVSVKRCDGRALIDEYRHAMILFALCGKTKYVSACAMQIVEISCAPLDVQKVAYENLVVRTKRGGKPIDSAVENLNGFLQRNAPLRDIGKAYAERAACYPIYKDRNDDVRVPNKTTKNHKDKAVDEWTKTLRSGSEASVAVLSRKTMGWNKRLSSAVERCNRELKISASKVLSIFVVEKLQRSGNTGKLTTRDIVNAFDELGGNVSENVDTQMDTVVENTSTESVMEAVQCTLQSVFGILQRPGKDAVAESEESDSPAIEHLVEKELDDGATAAELHQACEDFLESMFDD